MQRLKLAMSSRSMSHLLFDFDDVLSPLSSVSQEKTPPASIIDANGARFVRFCYHSRSKFVQLSF